MTNWLFTSSNPKKKRKNQRSPRDTTLLKTTIHTLAKMLNLLSIRLSLASKSSLSSRALSNSKRSRQMLLSQWERLVWSESLRKVKNSSVGLIKRRWTQCLVIYMSLRLFSRPRMVRLPISRFSSQMALDHLFFRHSKTTEDPMNKLSFWMK